MYDVVVVGAGLGGLSSALTLARAGKKVAIIEKHFLPGGYATNFKRKGTDGKVYEFDVSLHGIGSLKEGEHLYEWLHEVEIANKVQFLRKKETATILYKGREIDIPDSFEDYLRLILQLFPHEEAGLRKLFSYLMDVYHDMNKVYDGKGAPVYFNQLQSVTIEDFLFQYVQDEEVMEFFSFLWLYYGLPTNQLSALYYILPWISYHIGGTFYIEGGAQALSDAFVSEIKKHGGEVHLRQEVIEVVVKENVVQKVRTKKGKEFAAEQFIFNGDPIRLFDLVSKQSTETLEYKEKLKSLKVGTSLIQLYIALDCHPSELGMNKSDYFTFQHTSKMNWRYIEEGNYEAVDFGITNYSEMDPSLNEQGGVVVVVTGDLMEHWPERGTSAYKEKKEAVIEIFLRRLDEQFPGVREHIVVAELGTPRTMERYTNNTGGAVYGWEQSITQSGFNRLGHGTPLTNVYLAGSWTNPGGGFEGAMVSGKSCAKRILRKQRHTSKKDIQNLSPDAFMNGMVEKFSGDKAVQKHYTFQFTNLEPYHVSINDGKAIVTKGSKDVKSDATILVDFETWKDISFGRLAGEDALMDGRLKVEGNMEAFMLTKQYFGGKNDRAVRKTFGAEQYIPITLIPWMIYWAVGDFIQKDILMLIGITCTLMVMFLFKPKAFKEVTFLEGVTLFAFASYGVFENDLLMNGLLIGTLFISALCNRPMTGEYAKWRYPDGISKGKLFLKINNHVTYMWAGIFLVQFICLTYLPKPFSFIWIVCPIIGGILSAIYPKKKMQG